MKPRCTWTGYLKISLVTVPVRVYTAISTTEKITFHQLHKGCHQRIRQRLVCPVHGEVERTDLVKGYEVTTDQFAILTESDLESVRLETTGTIDLVQFVKPAELDPMHLDAPYYVGPDGPVAEQGFAVVREALRRTKRIGIGRVVLNGKEKLLALQPYAKGLVFFTLRHASEVRPAALYFADLSNQSVDAAQLALAQRLIESKSSALNLAGFTDRYQTAVLDLIRGKIQGTAPVLVPRSEVGQALGLMEALRQSVAKPEPKPMVRSHAQLHKNRHKRVVLIA